MDLFSFQGFNIIQKDTSPLPYFLDKIKLKSNKNLDKKDQSLKITFACKICLLKWTSKKYAIQHLIKKHELKFNEIDNKFDVYMDQIENIQNNINLKTIKNDIKLIKKRNIYKKLKNKNMFFNALKIESNKNKNKTRSIKASCPHCNKILSSLDSLKIHIDKIHLNKPCKVCDICNKGFPNKKRWMDHQFKIHGIKHNYSICEYCSHKCESSAALLKHIRYMHERVRNFICETCGFACPSQHFLSIHKRKHTKQKPFQCKICHGKYVTSTSARHHLEKIHNVIVPRYNSRYICEADNYIDRIDEVGAQKKYKRKIEANIRNCEKIKIKL